MFPKGPDTSLYQGSDISRWLRGSNFSIVKVSEAAFPDPELQPHLAQSVAAPNIIGTMGYHYLDAFVTPEEQAAVFLGHADTRVDRLVLDWEAAALDKPNFAIRFATEVLNNDPHHRGIGLYCSEGNWKRPVADAKYNGKPLFNFFWVANRSGFPVGHYEPYLATRWTFWQYTNVPIDFNYFNGSLNSLRAFFGKQEIKLMVNPVVTGNVAIDTELKAIDTNRHYIMNLSNDNPRHADIAGYLDKVMAQANEIAIKAAKVVSSNN